MSYNVFDIETSIATHLKRKASPFLPANKVIAVGWKRKEDKTTTGTWFKQGHGDGWLSPLLEGVTMLVGFNIKFDLLHAMMCGPLNRKAWIDFVVRGGNVWDCQLAEYLIGGMAQEVQMISMDETAPKYGGNLKNDAIKSLWAAGVDTADIDRDLLMEYLLGVEGDPFDLGDIGNTETIFLAQVDIARKRKQMKSILLNMGALLFTIEAEYNGMYVDKELGLKLAEAIAIELEKSTAELNTYLPPDLPFDFAFTNRYHLSPLTFGGKVKYQQRVDILDEHGNKTYVQKKETHYVLANGDTVSKEMYLQEINSPEGARPLAYYGSGKMKGEAKTKQVTVPDIEKGPKQRWEDRYWTFPGYTKPDEEWASSTEGLYSVSADVIKELGLRGEVPFTVTLGRNAKLSKDISTYYLVQDPKSGEWKGLLTLVDADGIVHHQLHMVRTITARLSSSDPNLQNVSKGAYDEDKGTEEGSQIKRCFVSRFVAVDNGNVRCGKIIQSDFTSLEIYVQATLTKCQQLIEDLKAGLDMHCLRAEQAWGEGGKYTYDFILAAAKDDHHPEHKKWKKLRGNAKVFSFQRAYGAGVAKIAKTTGMSIEDVEALVLAESVRYPEIEAYITALTKEVHNNRVPTNRICDHPQVAGLKCQLGKSMCRTPDGKVYSFSESPSPAFLARRGQTQSFNPTEIKNYPVQGTGGEWMKAAMWLMVREFYRRNNFDGLALIVNTVHDAAYLDAHNDVANEAACLMHSCMLEASNFIAWHFKWDIPLEVPCETKMGNNMMEEHDPPEGWLSSSDAMRAEIRKLYMQDYKHTYH